MEYLQQLDDTIFLLLNKDDKDKERRETLVDGIQNLKQQFHKVSDYSNNALTSKLICQLKEVVLSHRWVDVIKILQGLTENIDSEPHILQKLAYEVFHQEETKSLVLFQQFVNKLQSVKHYECQELGFDYFLFSLLSSQQEYDRVSKVKVKRKVGQVSDFKAKKQHFETLNKAHQGLVYYIDWCKLHDKIQSKQMEPSSFMKGSVQESPDSLLANQKELEVLYERTLQCFQVCHGKNGVWDIFITKEIQMMTHHNKIAEAQKIAEEYAENNPENPYSLKLLYNFYSQYNDDTPKKLEILKKICRLDKGGLCMKELYCMYKENDKPCNDTLPLVFTMLDYPKWMNDEEIWSYLVSELAILQQKNELDILRSEWESRKDWWSSFHFTFSQHQSGELLFYKALAAMYLLSHDAEFVEHVISSGKLDQTQKNKIYTVKKSLER